MMLAPTVCVVTTAALCTLFPETRWLGVVAAALLAYFRPRFVIVAVAVAALIVFLFHLVTGSEPNA